MTNTTPKTLYDPSDWLEDMLKDYCERQGLELMSADDLLAQGKCVNYAQRQWLIGFSRIWRIVEENY